MNIKKISFYTCLFSVLFIVTSCGKWFDINDDPNAITNAPLPQVMTSSGVALGFIMGSDVNRYSLILSQQFAGQGGNGGQTKEYMGYNITPVDVANVFRFSYYAGLLSDLEYIIKISGTTSPHYAGVAKTMKAFAFHTLVDNWGDIPFSEALKQNANIQPKYDNDEDIYNGIFALLNEAISDLNAANSALRPGTDDVIYAGNLDRWTRLAYTLQLRLMLRYTDKTTRIDALLANSSAKFLRDNSDNFNGRFAAANGSQNPIHQFEEARQDVLFPSKTIVDMMNAKQDPRRRWYFTNLGTSYTGAPNDRLSLQSTAFSRFHVFLRGDSTGTATNAARGRVDTYTGAAPIRMLTYSEYCFILAEYHFAKNATATAQTWLQNGIRASMQMVGASTSSITNYIAAQGILAGTNADLEKIIEEKYVANYGVAIEPWTDLRRTGFPKVIINNPPLNAVVPNLLRVLPYPQQERDSNPNTPARADLTVKTIFWDK